MNFEIRIEIESELSEKEIREGITAQLEIWKRFNAINKYKLYVQK